MSVKKEELLRNVKRQAKRLQKILLCPLGQAQEHLANCVYSCESYGQLISLLKAESFEQPELVLSGLYPKADLFVYKLLNTHIDSIIIRFEESLGKDKINEKNILSIFAIEPDDFKQKNSL